MAGEKVTRWPGRCEKGQQAFRRASLPQLCTWDRPVTHVTEVLNVSVAGASEQGRALFSLQNRLTGSQWGLNDRVSLLFFFFFLDMAQGLIQNSRFPTFLGA